MKLMLIALLSISSAFAADEVLLKCTRTAFSDLDKIEVLAHADSGLITVTEIDEQGQKNIYTREISTLETKEIELSSWYGYSRKLYHDGHGWNIEHHDECSGGVSTAVCQ